MFNSFLKLLSEFHTPVCITANMERDLGDADWIYGNTSLYRDLAAEIPFVHNGENVTMPCPELTVELDSMNHPTTDQSVTYQCM